MNYPFRHVSIRVPWHDTAWDGRVCANPRLNGSCLKLKRIGESRDDAAEEAVAGKSLKVLPQEQWPCCVAERVGFMAPFEYVRVANHPYNWGPDCSHGHFAPTSLRHPAYSAAAVPFGWMLSEEMARLAEEHELDVDSECEPDLGFETAWVQDQRNQRALSECFSSHLKAEESLCFFYAKQVPFVEDYGARRVIIGVGRVLHVGDCIEYEYKTKNLKDKLRSILWERMIQHSIRPDFKDGFLLPYHAALQKAAEDPEFDPAEIAAFTPDDRLLEFSHVSQLVTHDAALASLFACAESLRKAKGVFPGPWDKCSNGSTIASANSGRHAAQSRAWLRAVSVRDRAGDVCRLRHRREGWRKCRPLGIRGQGLHRSQETPAGTPDRRHRQDFVR